MRWELLAQLISTVVDLEQGVRPGSRGVTHRETHRKRDKEKALIMSNVHTYMYRQ